MENFSIIIDVALVVFVLINIFDGRKKGFVKIVLSFAAMIVTWLLASEMSYSLANWVNENFAKNWALSLIENSVANNLENGTKTFIEVLPDYLVNIIKVSGISVDSLAVQIGNSADTAMIAEKIYEIISPVIYSVLVIISFFILFAIINAVLSIAVNFASKIFNLPVLKSFNRLLGSFVGALNGILVIALICVVLSLV